MVGNENALPSTAVEEKKRFASTTAEDRQRLIDDAASKKTIAATKTWLRTFQQYCQASNNPCDLQEAASSQIASTLEKFYADVRKEDGQQYRRASMLAARSALNRHLQSIERKVNIISDPDFLKANKVLDSVLKEKQRTGMEPCVDHKKPISDDD